MADLLPPFPVDDTTLDLLWTAINPGPDAERTSLGDFLVLMSQMAGSDTQAVEEESDGIRTMRDPQYHHNGVIEALITEIRRLRRVGKVSFDEAWKRDNDG